MQLSRFGRRYYEIRLGVTTNAGDPIPADGWEASFDHGITWVPSEVIVHDSLEWTAWLLAGPDADEGTAVAVVPSSMNPLARVIDNPEIEVVALPRITLVAGITPTSTETVTPPPTSGGGGGGGSTTTDGVGAVFFGGTDLTAGIDNTYNFSNFVVSDDPPRAPQRDDLMVIDPDDDTIINVVQSGLYEISLNVPVQPVDLVVQPGEGPFLVEAVVQVWVAGNSQPPAYDYNNRAQWLVAESSAFLPTAFTNWTFPQVLLAGDTIRLAVKATQTAAIGTLGGTVGLNPDITFVLTYRGPVDL